MTYLPDWFVAWLIAWSLASTIIIVVLTVYQIRIRRDFVRYQIARAQWDTQLVNAMRERMPDQVVADLASLKSEVGDHLQQHQAREMRDKGIL